MVKRSRDRDRFLTTGPSSASSAAVRWRNSIRKLAAATVLVATIAFGISATTHAHHVSRGDDCATCRVVHAPMLAPEASPIDLALLAFGEPVPVREVLTAPAPRLEGVPPRGPPPASC